MGIGTRYVHTTLSFSVDSQRCSLGKEWSFASAASEPLPAESLIPVCASSDGSNTYFYAWLTDDEYEYWSSAPELMVANWLEQLEPTSSDASADKQISDM